MTQSGKRIPHEFNLEEFKKSVEEMIAIDSGIGSRPNKWIYESIPLTRTYSAEDVNNILKSGDITQQRILSNYYFSYNSYYRQVISYYASLLSFLFN